jgi:hypothetical protein
VNRWRRRRRMLLVGLAVLVLVGCTGDEGSAGTPRKPNLTDHPVRGSKPTSP